MTERLQDSKSYLVVQTCYYCDKDLYAVDNDSYVVCSRCWKKEGLK